MNDAYYANLVKLQLIENSQNRDSFNRLMENLTTEQKMMTIDQLEADMEEVQKHKEAEKQSRKRKRIQILNTWDKIDAAFDIYLAKQSKK